MQVRRNATCAPQMLAKPLSFTEILRLNDIFQDLASMPTAAGPRGNLNGGIRGWHSNLAGRGKKKAGGQFRCFAVPHSA